jgi:hypothetical protein
MAKPNSPSPNIQFNDDIDLLVWKPMGLLNQAMVDDILASLKQHEDAAPRPFDRFTDTSAVAATDLTSGYIFEVALFRRLRYSGRQPVKSAFYVTDENVARVVRVHAMVTAGSPLQVAMFENREEAAKWLGVPVARLTIAN